MCSLTEFPKIGDEEWIKAKNTVKSKISLIPKQETSTVITKNSFQDLAEAEDLGTNDNHGELEVGNQKRYDQTDPPVDNIKNMNSMK